MTTSTPRQRRELATALEHTAVSVFALGIAYGLHVLYFGETPDAVSTLILWAMTMGYFAARVVRDVTR